MRELWHKIRRLFVKEECSVWSCVSKASYPRVISANGLFLSFCDEHWKEYKKVLIKDHVTEDNIEKRVAKHFGREQRDC